MLIDLKFTLITKPVIGYNEKNKFVSHLLDSLCSSPSSIPAKDSACLDLPSLLRLTKLM